MNDNPPGKVQTKKLSRGNGSTWDNLEVLTFTGLDRQTDSQTIQRIGEKYPRVEFGVLLGSQAGDPSARRYLDPEGVKQWRSRVRKSDRAFALHLCGRFARAALGDEDRDEVLGLCQGFDRVQINAPDYDVAQVVAFARAVDCPRVILQRRAKLGPDWTLPHPKMEYLFDLSGGRGLESIATWPPPDVREVRSGYAGGLNPANIAQGLQFVASFPEHRFWLDMESGVRTAEDWLDPDKVEAVCAIAFPQH